VSLNFNDGQSGDDLEIAEPAILYSDVCILCVTRQKYLIQWHKKIWLGQCCMQMPHSATNCVREYCH
jgi:hypothetical protein